MQNLVRGAVAGLLATAPMTVVIGAGHAAGLMRNPPPVEITENVAEAAGADPERRSAAFQAGWLAAHAGYGIACGMIFVPLRGLLPRSDIAAGLLFGGAVWGISYIGLLPALRLYPAAPDDSRRRQAVMITAHAVYGTALAVFDRLLLDKTRLAAFEPE